MSPVIKATSTDQLNHPILKFDYDFETFNFPNSSKAGQSKSDDEHEVAASREEINSRLDSGVQDMIAVLSHAIQEAKQGELI